MSAFAVSSCSRCIAPDGRRMPCASTRTHGVRSPRTWASSRAKASRRIHRAVLTDDPSLAAPRGLHRGRQHGSDRSGAAAVARRPPGSLLGVGGALLLAAALAVARSRRDARSDDCRHRLRRAELRWHAIDPETNRVVAAIPVGARPASVVFARRSAVGREPRRRHGVAGRPEGRASREDDPDRDGAQLALAGGHDAIWAIGGDGVILRIDPRFQQGRRPDPRPSRPERCSASRLRPAALAATRRRRLGRSRRATSRRPAYSASTRTRGRPRR